MAKGYDKHQQRQADLNAQGRSLARRSKSCCELCEAKGVSLQPWEVPPVAEEVDPQRCILLCEKCRKGAEGGALDDPRWKLLSLAVWTELIPVQVVAVRLLHRLAADGTDWALSLKDDLYLDPEVQAWVGQS